MKRVSYSVETKYKAVEMKTADFFDKRNYERYSNKKLREDNNDINYFIISTSTYQ
ncbi:hypothetical protein IS250_1621 [Staphylococcus epidermidis IS-250]|nr:hypothetical protein IS250_1621 [Staphylococcus epidermidis IS-250]